MASKGRIWLGIIIVGILVTAAIVLLSISFRTIESHEVGVVYNVAARKLGTDVKGGGLYTVTPGADIIIFPSVFKAMSFTGSDSIKCIDYDGVDIVLDVTYQFRPQEEKITELIALYTDYDKYHGLLTTIGKSALLHACSLYNTYEIIARRQDFAEECRNHVVEAYAEIGCDVSGLQVDNIARPEKYDENLREKEAAREKRVVKLAERKKLLVKRETELEEEIAKAAIRITNAESQAKLQRLQAAADAELIAKWFDVEIGVYGRLTAQGFTGPDLLKYLEVDMISNAKQPVFVGLDAPVNLTLT